MPGIPNVKDFSLQTHRIIAQTGCFSKGGLAVGTTANKANMVNAVQYTLNGKALYKAAANDLFIPAGTPIAANANQACTFLFGLDANANAVVAQGPLVSANATAFPLPDVPVDANGDPTMCPVGYIKVVTANGAAFTPGTTGLNAANITTTYVDLCRLPGPTVP